MRPETTKVVTLTASYQRLATLYNETFSDAIKSPDLAEIANGALVSAITQGAEIAFGLSQPTSSGHPIAAGDSMIMANQEFIKRAWVRYATNGAILIITPNFG